MKTSRLEIRLLGPVTIAFNHQSLKISRKVERAILYYLAVENSPVSRTILIDLLWPQAEQLDPRGTLRTALSRLRKTLPDSSLLITDLDQVSLDFTRCKIDVLKFEESYQSLHSILSGMPENFTLPLQIVNQITESLDQWHGDRVIQGDDLSVYPGLDEWRKNLDRYLSLHREFLMKRLASHHQACGQLERAMDLFTHLGRLNYLDISSHFAVLDILTKLGRHQESLEYCDALEVIFEREYNAPLPGVLLERCRYSHMLMEEIHTRRGRDWPVPLSMQLPLVGRTDELGQLRRAFFSGGLVKVQGEMGTGKTRLVQELYESLSPKPMLILAPSRESESTLPLAPIIHGLRRHIPKEIWGELDAVWANQLSLLFPELHELRADLSPSPDSKWPSARQHLFDAILQLLGLVARRFGRILFFLDDAQWADDQTIAVFSYLVTQGFFDEHGALIAAIRVEDLDNNFNASIDRLHRTHPVKTITVSGLNPDELRLLTQQALNQHPSTSFIDALYRETNGNPFWALEIIRHLLETPGSMDAVQTTGQLSLPASVHALIRNRLNRLRGESHYILTCAAVLGNDISVKLLQAVVDISQQEFLSALDPLIRSGLLQTHQVDHTHEEKLFFTHEKIREVIITETAPIHQQILHQQIAHLLSQDPHALDNAAVIADHYLSGGDIANAFHWLLQAAAHAWTLGAATDVLRSYRQAEDLINHAPEGFFSHSDILQLYKQWGDFAFQSNQVDMLEEVGVKLQHYAKNEPDPLMMGTSNLVLSDACCLREDFETGLMLSESAVKDLESAHNPEMLIQALFHQLIIQWWTLDFNSIIQTAEQMSKIIENLDPQSPQKVKYMFNARRMVSEVYYAQGEAERALRSAQETYQAFFQQLDTFDRLRAYNMLAYSHLISGQVDDCMNFARAGLEIAQALDNTFIEELLLIILCKAEIVHGHLDHAYQHATRALNLAEKSSKIQIIVAANTLLGDLFNILQNTTLAMQYFRIAQVRQGFFFQSYYGLENNIHLGRLLTRNGHLEEARQILRTTLAVTEQKSMAHLHIQALMVDGLIDLVEHDYASAEGKFLSALDLADQKGLVHEVIWGKYRLALLEFDRQRFDLAEKHLVEVLEQAKSHQMTLMLQFALGFGYQLSKTFTSQIDPDEIRSTFQSLVDSLEAHTQTTPLRQDFLNARRIWQESGYLP